MITIEFFEDLIIDNLNIAECVWMGKEIENLKYSDQINLSEVYKSYYKLFDRSSGVKYVYNMGDAVYRGLIRNYEYLWVRYLFVISMEIVDFGINDDLINFLTQSTQPLVNDTGCIDISNKFEMSYRVIQAVNEKFPETVNKPFAIKFDAYDENRDNWIIEWCNVHYINKLHENINRMTIPTLEEFH